MRVKLIPGSARITQMFNTKAFYFRTFYKWHRFSFSNSKEVPFVNNACLKFQILTSKKFDLLPVRSEKSLAAHVEEDVFLELMKLMENGLLKRKVVDKALLNRASYRDHNMSLLVLKCISKLPDVSPENRVAMSEEFLKEVKSVGGVVTTAHCVEVLECYLRSKYFLNLDSFLSIMESYGVNYSNEIKLMVFKCQSVKGIKQEDFALIGELENSNCTNNDELYAAKIYNLSASGNIKEALEEIKKMKGKQIKIGSDMYTSLLKAVALQGDKHYFENLTRDVSLEGITLSGDQISEILENIALSEHYNLISDVSAKSPWLDVVKLLCVDEVLLRSSHIVLIKLIHSNKVELAYAFLKYLFSLKNICESGDKELCFYGMCKSFIEESCEINCSMNELIEKCKQLQKLNECPYSLEYALYCCLKKADLRRSLAILRVLFNENSALEPHYFWPLLVTFAEKFGDEGIIFVLDKMVELRVPFNPETLKDYVFPHLSHIHLAKDILKRVKMTEAQQELLIEVLLLYAIEKRLFKESLEFMNEYPWKEDRDPKYLENCLMEALLENPNSEEAVLVAKKTNAVDPFLVISKLWSQKDKLRISQLSKYFKKHNMFIKKIEKAKEFMTLNENHPVISKAVSGLINESAVREESDATSFKVKKPSRFEQSILLEEAEVILEELKSKNMNTLGQTLRLMKMYLQSQMYDKAVKAKKEVFEIVKENPEFSSGYLIMLARLSAYEGDTDGVIRYFSILREKNPHFIVGSVTGIALCLHLIQNNHYKEMLSILRVLPKWEGKVENFSSIAVQVLREVARLGMPELTDLVFKMMLQKKFVRVNQNSLQVYSQSYLCAGDLEGAVKEYERVAADHGIVCNTKPIVWTAVQEGRLDLAEKITLFRLTKSKRKYSVLSLLTMIASKGDVELLLSYSEKFSFPLDHDLMIRTFVEGTFPTCPAIAFNTLIVAAMRSKLPYQHFVEGAVKRILMEKDDEGAKDFLQFCKSNQIAFDKDQVSRLRIHSELREIDAASKNISNYEKV